MTALAPQDTFPAATEEAWLARVAAALKGVPFEEKLITWIDGLRIAPLYQRQETRRAERPNLAPWTVFQRADHPQTDKANAQALDDLANGATGLVLVGAEGAGARGFGVSSQGVPRILDGVTLHAIALRVEGDAQLAQAVARYAAAEPIDPQRLDISFGLTDVPAAQTLLAMGFDGEILEADGRPWHERGVGDAGELGATLATATSFLRQAEARHIGVTLAAGPDVFLTLAKFRAMRLLWERVQEVSGLPPAPLRLHGETSFRMMAGLDPHTNILRACAAVSGAGLGGASSFTVLPFSIAQGLPNGFARRIARNVQNVLLEEANLWRVNDPASGAGYVEDLSTQLCEQAWTVFQRCEKGDWPEPGKAARGLPIIGTSAYRLPTEYPAETDVL